MHFPLNLLNRKDDKEGKKKKINLNKEASRTRQGNFFGKNRITKQTGKDAQLIFSRRKKSWQ